MKADLCLVSRRWQLATFGVIVLSAVLNLIVMMGQLRLFSRIEALELRASLLEANTNR